MENPWPSSHILKDNLICWKTNMTDVVKLDFGDKWEYYRNKSSGFYDNAGDLEKNPLAIAKTLELAWEDNKVSTTLLGLVDRIITFAKR
jgi:hypothetical protein